MADHADREEVATWVQQQVEATHVMEDRLTLNETCALGLIRQLVEVAAR